MLSCGSALLRVFPIQLMNEKEAGGGGRGGGEGRQTEREREEKFYVGGFYEPGLK